MRITSECNFVHGWNTSEHVQPAPKTRQKESWSPSLYEKKAGTIEEPTYYAQKGVYDIFSLVSRWWSRAGLAATLLL